MKKILLLNAGHTEIPIIEELKKMGCYIITSGAREDMPGHKLSDLYIKADYSDKEAILKICQENELDGIISNAYDSGLISAAYVSEKMGWKGHDTYKNTVTLHQKDLFKKLCIEMKIPSPLSVSFINKNDAYSYVKNIEYPIIVKACDQASGIGILKACNYEESLFAIDNAFDKSREKRIVIEPFIVGTQESFNAFVINKKVVSSVSCNCYSPINPYLIQTETLLSDNYELLKNNLINIIENLFKKLNLVDGIITLQYIVKDNKPYIIEIMRRCLGNRYLTAAQAVNGFPWYKALVHSELGLDCSNLKSEKPLGKYCGHHAIMSTQNGIYRGTKIPNEIMSHVFEYDELFYEGQKITNYKSQRMGYIYYVYDTKEEIDNAANTFNKKIKLNVE